MMTMTNQKNENNENKIKCTHCESIISKNAIHEKDSGNYFCCDGCRTVYQLINTEGYSSYYDKRVGYTGGAPVERTEVSADVFEEYVKLLDGGLSELTVLISGIRCASCVWLIENYLVKNGHIESIRINYANHKAKIIFDPNVTPLDKVLKLFTSLGYCPLPISDIESKNDKLRKDYFYRFAVSAFFSMQLMVYSAALYAGYFQGISENFKYLFQFISFGLATPVVFYSAYPFFKNALSALRHKHFTMDTLVAIGSGCAYLYSIAAIFTHHETYFDTAATIITLILLGRFIEVGAKQRGGSAVSKLLSLKPKKVRKVIGDINASVTQTVVVPIEQLLKDDYFEVTESNNIAADGKIVAGVADIDESMLTGESVPTTKIKGDQVFAGTKIINGKIIVRVENTSSDTFLSKIALAVENAQYSKAPIQDVADRFIGYFVPFVISIALGTFICWYSFGDIGLADSIMRAVSVLVIACPCAMGLATPLAVINASAKLTETGIIFKSGEVMEKYAVTNDFYFDKTGTITKGEMNVADYRIIENGVREKGNILKLITSAASYSKHPASSAISKLDTQIYSSKVLAEDIAGKGIKALIDNLNIIIGSLKFMEENSVTVTSEDIKASKGYTIVYAAIEGVLCGVFGVTDIIRDEAAEVISKLQKSGNTVTILTGDNINAARMILEYGKIDAELKSGLSPFEKSEIIKSAKDTSKTVMIGDGINDSIALCAASVGIAMRNGNDISLESASVVLLRNDLDLIITSKRICKKALRIIKENLFWAFSYNIIAIPLAISGYIHPVMSAAFMSVSSLIVVTNSSRIKKS